MGNLTTKDTNATLRRGAGQTRTRVLALGVLALGMGCVGAVTGSFVLLALAAGVAVAAARRELPVLFAFLAIASLLGCSQVTTRPEIRNVPVQRLGFVGRVTGGETPGLPSSVAGALDHSSDVQFLYEERVAQSHSELPVALELFTSVVHLLGVPMGRDRVQATADLTIVYRAHEIARYHGESEASHLYGLYYYVTLRELEDEARRSVRRVIDEALYQDAGRVAAAVRTPES